MPYVSNRKQNVASQIMHEGLNPAELHTENSWQQANSEVGHWHCREPAKDWVYPMKPQFDFAISPINSHLF